MRARGVNSDSGLKAGGIFKRKSGDETDQPVPEKSPEGYQDYGLRSGCRSKVRVLKNWAGIRILRDNMDGIGLQYGERFRWKLAATLAKSLCQT